MNRRLLCFAHGRNGEWEAICVDLDIAVQGRSPDEVRVLLNEAIATYIADAKAESPEVAARLLNRRAPWWVRARHVLSFTLYALSSRSNGDDQAGFSVPCHA